MSHADQIRFFDIVMKHFPDHFAGSVIDIGALDVNGGPHDRMSPAKYVGVDLSEGPNISIVSKGEDLDLPTGSFDVAMSSECFEHNPHWRATLQNMIRMTRQGGLVAFSCATTGRPEHGTTRSDGGWAAPLAVEQGQEYYDNVTASQVRAAIDDHQIPARFIVINDRIFDLYFVGIKGQADPGAKKELAACREELNATYQVKSSYESTGAFLNNRARRYVARGVGDSTLETIRRRWGRVVP